MSTHLLPVGRGDDIPVYYRQIKSSDDITSIFTYEHNRILYIGILTNNSVFQFQLLQINLLTNELTKLTDIPGSSIGNFFICGMVVDDDYVYLSSVGGNFPSVSGMLYRINLKTYTVDKFQSGSGANQCYGPIVMYDDTTIVSVNGYGFVFFDTVACQWKVKTQQRDYGCNDITVGKNIIMGNASSSTILLYRVKQDSFGTLTVPYNKPTIACYYDGKFYIAQTNYLYIFDEETETLKSTITVPWNNPSMIRYTNGMLSVTQANSNVLFIYDLNKKIYKQIILQWKVPAFNMETIRMPTTFKGYYFLPDVKLCIVDYTKNAKYNLGYKFDQFTFIFNSKLKDEYTFDENFVSFEDSYLTINDGDIKLTPTIVDAENKIKKVHVNKSQYTKIKSISYEVS